MAAPSFMWGICDAKSFTYSLAATYAEVVYTLEEEFISRPPWKLWQELRTGAKQTHLILRRAVCPGVSRASGSHSEATPTHTLVSDLPSFLKTDVCGDIGYSQSSTVPSDLINYCILNVNINIR